MCSDQRDESAYCFHLGVIALLRAGACVPHMDESEFGSTAGKGQRITAAPRFVPRRDELDGREARNSELLDGESVMRLRAIDEGG